MKRLGLLGVVFLTKNLS